MTICADIESARPIAATALVTTEATAAEPPSENVIWVMIVQPPSAPLVIPVVTGTQPFAPARIISNEQMDSDDWITSEYPWSPKETPGFIAGEIQWPKVDLDY